MMRKHINDNHSRLLPDFTAKDIHDVDFALLKKLGVKTCLYDLDHTILFHGTHLVDKSVIEYLKNSSLEIYIATNRQHSDELDIIAKQIGAKGIVHARNGSFAKPSQKYYGHAIKLAGYKPQQIAMIGDRLLQDVWGANRAGIRTVMVGKFGPIKWWDQPISLLDRLIPVIFKKHYRETS